MGPGSLVQIHSNTSSACNEFIARPRAHHPTCGRIDLYLHTQRATDRSIARFLSDSADCISGCITATPRCYVLLLASGPY